MDTIRRFDENIAELSRRVFLSQSTLFLAGAGGLSTGAFALSANELLEEEPVLRIALLTDVHHADQAERGNRYYRESLDKLTVAADEWGKTPIDFAVELGDYIDSAGNADTDKKALRTISAAYAKIGKRQHYVLGNHCVDTLTKEEFLGTVGQEKSYYSFDSKNWHFILLDACFRQDGVPYGRHNAGWTDTKIPDAELEWLRADLEATKLPSIIFLHQRLDLANQHDYSVKNADQVRSILEHSKKVRLVLQGHDHKGDFKEIGGIPYCTLSAMVEGTGRSNNSFARLDIMKNMNLRLHGFFKQESYTMSVNT